MTPVIQEIHSWIGTPFQWGKCDCMLVLADWIERIHGVDICADVRLTYDSAASCQKETGFFRDPLGTMERFVARAELARTDAPVKGDIGLLLVHQNGVAVPCGGLFLGKHWAIKSEGLGATTLEPVKIIAAWSVGYEA